MGLTAQKYLHFRRGLRRQRGCLWASDEEATCWTGFGDCSLGAEFPPHSLRPCWSSRSSAPIPFHQLPLLGGWSEPPQAHLADPCPALPAHPAFPWSLWEPRGERGGWGGKCFFRPKSGDSIRRLFPFIFYFCCIGILEAIFYEDYDLKRATETCWTIKLRFLLHC